MMGINKQGNSTSGIHSDEEIIMDDVKKGPWTVEEDAKLMEYVSIHGEGRWNSVACSSGLKRTGKSCRLRWLNYLRPDVRRGNITLQEQLLILELHSRWGNRWSQIAQHLPGRTDNEIKNYWRTRVQKQAKQLKCDVNSKQFRDTMRYVWIPRLMERIQASKSSSGQPGTNIESSSSTNSIINKSGSGQMDRNFSPELPGSSTESFDTQISSVSDLTGEYGYNPSNTDNNNYIDTRNGSGLLCPGDYSGNWGINSVDFRAAAVSTEEMGGDWLGEWNDENIWTNDVSFLLY